MDPKRNDVTGPRCIDYGDEYDRPFNPLDYDDAWQDRYDSDDITMGED